MFRWFRTKIESLRDKRRLARSVDPESFRTLAAELRELADLAKQLWPRQHKFHIKIERIQAEMEQLDKLASKPEFKRLSSDKRVQLRENLLHSRNQILETMKTAPTPTTTLQ